jgi:hypothetical protein
MKHSLAKKYVKILNNGVHINLKNAEMLICNSNKRIDEE